MKGTRGGTVPRSVMFHSWTSPHHPHSNKAEASRPATHNLLSRSFSNTWASYALLRISTSYFLSFSVENSVCVGQELISPEFSGTDTDSNVNGKTLVNSCNPHSSVFTQSRIPPLRKISSYSALRTFGHSYDIVYVLTGGALLCSNGSIYIISWCCKHLRNAPIH